MRLITGLVIALSFIVFGCGSQESSSDNSEQDAKHGITQPDVHQQFAWLAGTWMRVTSRGAIYENWRADDSGLTGLVFRLREGDTVVTERIWLVVEGSDIYYVAQPQQNPDPVSFKMTQVDSLVATFDNPKHDFPTKITYLHRPPDSLVATIEGPPGDSSREIDFAYERIE